MAAADLDNTTWKLISYLDGVSMAEPPSGADVTLTFQDGAAGGHSACNRYRFPVTIGDGTLAFGMGVSTKMACAQQLMEMESRYLNALESVTSWQMAGNTLDLDDAAGQTLLVFAAG
jgi:heat shock protein HslJ